MEEAALLTVAVRWVLYCCAARELYFSVIWRQTDG
jgi:hypothetical protein